MPTEILNILLTALSIVVTSLVSWAVALFISWINTKIKDAKAAKWLTEITMIVTNAVQNVFQSFVQTLKEQGKFDEKAQKEAKERALAIIKSQLRDELVTYITSNYGDLEAWLNNQIEAIIYQLKN